MISKEIMLNDYRKSLTPSEETLNKGIFTTEKYKFKLECLLTQAFSDFMTFGLLKKYGIGSITKKELEKYIKPKTYIKKNKEYVGYDVSELEELFCNEVFLTETLYTQNTKSELKKRVHNPIEKMYFNGKICLVDSFYAFVFNLLPPYTDTGYCYLGDGMFATFGNDEICYGCEDDTKSSSIIGYQYNKEDFLAK